MKTPCIRLALLAAACLAGAVHAQSAVAPPPLPIGSQMARPEPGMSEPERKRAVRAHHHKMHHHKDVTRDDSVAAPAGAQPTSAGAAAAATGMGSGAAASVPGGAGTGPGREKTDRGASSFFFGKDKNNKTK
jgi:hypothetical protein